MASLELSWDMGALQGKGTLSNKVGQEAEPTCLGLHSTLGHGDRTASSDRAGFGAHIYAPAQCHWPPGSC